VREVFRVRTPENVCFEFELAGLPSRALALFVDQVVVWGLVLVLGVLALSSGAAVAGVGPAAWLVLLFVAQWGYGVGFEWWLEGRTPGKALLSLRVIGQDGVPPRLPEVAVRNLLRGVDGLPLTYLVGGLVALGDRSRRRLGDLAAGTVVVRERPARRAAASSALDPIAETALPAELRDARIASALRGVRPEERAALLAFATRREGFPRRTRQRLAERLARHLAEARGVPWPPHLSAERLVLHAAGQVAMAMTSGGRGSGTKGAGR